MAYVYKHIRLDTNEPFYIGIGSDNKGKYTRAYSKSRSRRNDWWHNIVTKTLYRVEIIEDKISWEQACDKEIYWISYYGRSDLGKGTLVNLTDGGDSIKLSKASINKLIATRKRNHPDIERNCQQCGNAFIGHTKYCSSNCSKYYSYYKRKRMPEETREYKKNKLISPKDCIYCKTNHKLDSKYCSNRCMQKYLYHKKRGTLDI